MPSPKKLMSNCFGINYSATVRWLGVLVLGLTASLAHSANPPAAQEGVSVGRASPLRHLVPAEQLEAQAARDYQQIRSDAEQKGILLPVNSKLAIRVREIAARLLPYTNQWYQRASQWTWQVSVLQTNDANAFCLPGGKIVFFTGLIEGLKLTDDEIAIVMAHEVAHVLREHGRERVGTQLLINGLGTLGAMLGWGDKAGGLAGVAGRALGTGASLAFSRSDETEADLIGLEIAARAGFNPRAGVSLWKKMNASSGGKSPPSFLSTHPSHQSRISEITANLPRVDPLYQRARAAK